MAEYFILYMGCLGVDTRPLKGATYINALKLWEVHWFIGICAREHNIPVNTLAASKPLDEIININVGRSTPALPTSALAIDISEPMTSIIDGPGLVESINDDNDDDDGGSDTISLSSNSNM